MPTTINVKITGVRGGTPSYSQNKGRIVTLIGNHDYIAVDAFKGFGETYKRREQPEIEINIFDKIVFMGTIGELFEKLSKEA